MGNFDSLDETFGITPTDVVKPIKKEKPKIVISDKSEDKEKDYQYARGELYSLIDKMQEAVNGAMEVAEESCHPRAWEVAMNGARHAADVVEKLADLHKKMESLEGGANKPSVSQQGGTQQNIFMTGSTAELMRAIKEMNKEEDK